MCCIRVCVYKVGIVSYETRLQCDCTFKGYVILIKKEKEREGEKALNIDQCDRNGRHLLD